jgi:hypothetical protein
VGRATSCWNVQFIGIYRKLLGFKRLI